MRKFIKKLFNKDITNYYCPVCNSEVENFNALPDFYKDEANKYGYINFGKGEMTAHDTYTCPHCGASDRERLYAYWLKEKIKEQKNSLNMIHFAPEQALSDLVKKYSIFKYATADLMMEGVDYKVDMMSMPFEENSFDCFICSHILEHVESDDQSISELYRILAPNGWGILMAPICTAIEHTLEDPSHTSVSQRWQYYGQNDHVRLYSHNDYVEKITRHGFKVNQLGIKQFGKKVFRQLGLKDSSILYIVEKL